MSSSFFFFWSERGMDRVDFFVNNRTLTILGQFFHTQIIIRKTILNHEKSTTLGVVFWTPNFKKNYR